MRNKLNTHKRHGRAALHASLRNYADVCNHYDQTQRGSSETDAELPLWMLHPVALLHRRRSDSEEAV